MTGRGFEYLDHAADVRIRAWGPEASQTLAQASLAMWSLVFDLSLIRPTIRWSVEVTASDMVELLVNLLNEQILLFDAEGLVPKNVEDTMVKEANGALVAAMRFSGASVDQLEEAPNLELKAVTYDKIRVTAAEAEFTIDI